ncbi:thioredoxin domain-containing protein [Haloferula rosea]|uniref:Thioredoxin domain-containing protein n=1 Tax=Haloferula rosea TaxID=490093 RepID=A0A934VDI0_9BACT|nr:thioredoxin domain-containing protein [Haloferula rosea]MBK1826294.1 thioredoxin domain-containing protein [Haloferula rosea]
MPNALSEETSPYLLQHQNNPVDWLPWGEAAFAKAKKKDKLVFLSIGYSTCHWCHVMEHESFENEAIAKVMNENFVCVKVDREERPDVDATYMAFVQATTGSGGWPMSVWLTPDAKPVVGGTYFPPDDRGGRPGFPKLCAQLGRLWKDDRARMLESADKVMEHLRSESKPDAVLRGLPSEKVFGDFIDRCEASFDPEWGGWGSAPKFPRPAVPRLLLQLVDRFGAKTEEGEACLQMVERTLKAMAVGGMHDQLGGGFHRYSVDRYWHVPHYEKMLYDQGQLALLYVEAFQVTGRADFRQVAERLFGYVTRDMKAAGGGFHAAEDADSLPAADSEKKREGAYWTWEADEIYRLLEPKAAALFCAAFGVEQDGNSRPESDPHGELKDQNTLFRAMPDPGLAEQFEMSEADVEQSLDASMSLLLTERAKRPHPHRDDKVITAWNGWMIAGLAKGGRVLGREDLLDAAEEAATFVKKHLWSPEGGLMRSWRGKAGEVQGFAVDYACLISGLLELHGREEGDRWLDWAVQLQGELDERYWEEEMAGYVMRSSLGDEVLMTILEDYDGAEPAANHVAAENLLRLEALKADDQFGKRAEAILRAGSLRMEKQGFASPVLLGAYDLKLRDVPKMDVRGVLDPELEKRLRRTYLPGAVWTKSDGPGEVIECRKLLCKPWP